jgi:hypothetical protein
MQTLTYGYRGMSLLFNLNWDRLLYAGTIVAALWAGSYLGTNGIF